MAQTVGDSTIGAGVGTEREDTLDQGAPALADIRALFGTGDLLADRFEIIETDCFGRQEEVSQVQCQADAGMIHRSELAHATVGASQTRDPSGVAGS